MKRDAEMHASEDKERREIVDLRNRADGLIYQTEKTLKEHGDKVPAAERGNIESAVNQLKEAVKTDDKQAIERSLDNLATASQTIGRIMYEEAAKQAGAAGGQPGAAGAAPGPEQPAGTAGASPGGAAKDEDVIDAEFEEKK